MKRQIKASWESYEDKFWDLHESLGVEEGTKIEDIIDELGWTDDFFPEEGEPTATEDQYSKVLAAYLHGRDYGKVASASIDDVMKKVEDTLGRMDGVKYAFINPGSSEVEFTLNNGAEYGLELRKYKSGW